MGEVFKVRAALRLPENPKSIITFLFPYRVPYSGKRNLSLYCIGNDYHTIIQKKLEAAVSKLKSAYPQNEFSAFCDNSPIREVKAAYLSGLGYLGKNGLIIHPKYGSYCFIGEIVTDLEFESYSSPLGFCLGCLKCRDSCRTGALNKDGSLNTSLCLSAITQKKGELTQEEQKAVASGGLIWGCDDCNLSCPMNKDAQYSTIPEFSENLTAYADENFIDGGISERAYGYKGVNILKRNLRILLQKGVNNNEN